MLQCCGFGQNYTTSLAYHMDDDKSRKSGEILSLGAVALKQICMQGFYLHHVKCSFQNSANVYLEVFLSSFFFPLLKIPQLSVTFQACGNSASIHIQHTDKHTKSWFTHTHTQKQYGSGHVRCHGSLLLQ